MEEKKTDRRPRVKQWLGPEQRQSGGRMGTDLRETLDVGIWMEWVVEVIKGKGNQLALGLLQNI